MDKLANTKESYTLEEIRHADDKMLSDLYAQHRSPFMRWAMWHYKCDPDKASEVYQKVFTIFYFNVKNGKLTQLTSSLNTYLCGIGKRVFYEVFRQQSKQPDSLEESHDVDKLDLSYQAQQAQNHRQQVVADLLGELGQKCQEVLRLFYFNRYSMESIANKLGYNSEAVAKKKKYECLKKLREKATTHNLEAHDLLD